ncbi:DUF983 domain-containing protein [uncultured Ferrovibrio sp.]|jgi:Uncharacterized protein conserved in bacteria|uniref:DUF983 domain-containing protein n=1 Tax=uncultured Ferrovibrio sp. TaxID=1576913 RepID=UPI002603F636|nr:DUF983 domain-containing protein [uncultured Ferrovibrio sp.]
MELRMDDLIERPIGDAMLRGWRCRCPQCGHGRIFGRYLKVNDACASCGLGLSGHRADDAPPYFTILIVGHIIVPLMLLLEQHVEPAEWVHMVLWVPLTLILSLWFLPHIKGALIGLQWSRRMHGFGSEPH